MFHGDLTLKRNLLMLSSFTETSLFLCLSTCLCHCQLTTKGRTGQINRSPPGSTLDYTTFVYTSTETASRPPSPTSSVGQPSAPAPQQSSSSPQQKPAIQPMVCKVSGNPSSDELFQGTLLTSSCSPGQLVLRNKILLLSQSGMTFVLNKKFILELSAVILP